MGAYAFGYARLFINSIRTFCTRHRHPRCSHTSRTCTLYLVCISPSQGTGRGGRHEIAACDRPCPVGYQILPASERQQVRRRQAAEEEAEYRKAEDDATSTVLVLYLVYIVVKRCVSISEESAIAWMVRLEPQWGSVPRVARRELTRPYIYIYIADCCSIRGGGICFWLRQTVHQ